MFQQIFAAVWYSKGIWRTWCSQKASEIYSSLVWMKILENKHFSAPNSNQRVPGLQVFYGLKNRTTSSSHCTMPKAAMAITWPHYKLRCSYTSLTPKRLKAIFRPFLKFGQAIVKAIFIKNSSIKLWIGGLVLAPSRTTIHMIPIFGLVLMSQNVFFFSIRTAKKLLIIKFFLLKLFSLILI
jgi:hypothetical protein